MNEGAEDALLQAMAKPLFIKRRQTQKAQGLWESTIREKGMRTHISTGFFFFPLPPQPLASPHLSIIFVIIRCVVKMLLFVYRWISPKKRRCGSEASGLGGQTHGQCASLLLFFNPYLQFLQCLPPSLTVHYSVPIKSFWAKQCLFMYFFFLASFKTLYNLVIASNPLGVTICLFHVAHAYRNTLMRKKRVDYKEGQT